MNTPLLVGIVFVATGFLFTTVFVAVIRRMNASLHRRELQEWAVLVRRNGAELRPITVTAACTTPNCGFAKLHRILMALDSAHELYSRTRSELELERRKTLDRPRVRQLVQEVRAWVKNSSPRYPQLLPILNVTLAAEDMTFRDYLALYQQVGRVILPSLDASKALAFEEMRMPPSTAKPSEWQLDDAACRDSLVEYFNKSNHLGEETWLNLLGSVYLNQLEKSAPK